MHHFTSALETKNGGAGHRGMWLEAVPPSIGLKLRLWLLYPLLPPSGRKTSVASGSCFGAFPGVSAWQCPVPTPMLLVHTSPVCFCPLCWLLAQSVPLSLFGCRRGHGQAAPY